MACPDTFEPGKLKWENRGWIFSSFCCRPFCIAAFYLSVWTDGDSGEVEVLCPS